MLSWFRCGKRQTITKRARLSKAEWFWISLYLPFEDFISFQQTCKLFSECAQMCKGQRLWHARVTKALERLISPELWPHFLEWFLSHASDCDPAKNNFNFRNFHPGEHVGIAGSAVLWALTEGQKAKPIWMPNDIDLIYCPSYVNISNTWNSPNSWHKMVGRKDKKRCRKWSMKGMSEAEYSTQYFTRNILWSIIYNKKPPGIKETMIIRHLTLTLTIRPTEVCFS